MAAKHCSPCDSDVFRRLSRKGWWQCTVLAKLGFYPWECVFCRRRSFFRDAGRRSRRGTPPGAKPT